MVDISLCPGGNCPQKEKCYRYTCEGDEYRQSYCDFYVEGEVCESFIKSPKKENSGAKSDNIEELSPEGECPFCGSENVAVDCYTDEDSGEKCYGVICTQCGAMGPFFNDEEAAIDGWDTRKE